MKGSRQSHSSLSSAISDRTCDRNRSKSHSSRASLESLRKSNKKMKFIIAVGVALPIIAAIIGVVAWAVSADTAFQGSSSSSLRRSDAASQEEDIFQILEDRHDMTYTRHPFDPEDRSPRMDGLHHPSVHQSTFDDTPEKDPLYIVHFVPSPKPTVAPPEASRSSGTLSQPNQKPESSSTPGAASNEVLQKILSASKGTKPGTPQFVVFAPMPSAEDDKSKDGDLTGMGATGLNFLAKPPTPHTEIDYDYEEELRKYQEMLNGKDENALKDTSRVGTSTDRSNTNIHKETLHVAAQNISIGNLYQSLQQHQPRSVGSSVGLHVSEFTKQPQVSYYQKPVQSQSFQESLQNSHPHPQQNYHQNIVSSHSIPIESVQNVHNFNHQQPNFNQPQQNTYNQLYAAPSVQQVTNHPQQYQHQQSQHQPSGVQLGATDRSGYESPLGGIKLSLGGTDAHGQKNILGASYSPLGIISSILGPIIKRPRVNLNGKLMFGVMLEKGVKFGHHDNKAHHQPQVAFG
ncbi:hypothetical protein JTE90_013282 [Oedothorax gibbosus]|uniref:Uncharacterized protein n=1 Tax=Oedothorax gibbosus TaxID=931172 RepID=A0AAV6VCX6_9ARAC|nr:hypothetical protein JTE90_013282 [Oedothorax gibbosus]